MRQIDFVVEKDFTEVLNSVDPLRDKLEAKCMAVSAYSKETGEWNGIGCDCPIVQGNYVCPLNPF